MFGFFKKKDTAKERVRLAIREEFDQTIAAARLAPLSKQARVGKGIIDALSDFDQKYTKESFQEESFPERIKFLEDIAKKQEELRLKGGDISIEHIGYSLVARWLIAVTMDDDQLLEHFDHHIAYFKRAAQTL